MFGEGLGTREEFNKAEFEIELSKNPLHKEAIEVKEVKDVKKNSFLKNTFKKATEFAKCFVEAKVEAKKEKVENS